MTAEKIIDRLKRRLLVMAATLACASPGALALPPDTYAAHSVLAEGSWSKISVETSGMHFIPASTLRSWGFSNPARVRIHGYGGARIPDLLSAQTYTDDLPEVPALRTPRGIYFYATGPVGWEMQGAVFRRVRNPFTSAGYYFITAGEREGATPATAGVPGCTAAPATEFLCPALHELEEAPMGEMGHNVYGEDFRLRPEQKISIDLPGRAEGTPVRLRTSFAVRSAGASTLEISSGGKPLGSPLQIPAVAEYHAGSAATASFLIPADGITDRLELTYSLHRSATIQAARLDFAEVNYTRRLALESGKPLLFTLRQPEGRLEGAAELTHVWDVTDPLAVSEMNIAREGAAALWTNSATGQRSYAAWTEGMTMPCPRLVATVANQDLHDASAAPPDMVIITVDAWKGEAERIARLRSQGKEKLSVTTVNADLIYNEFSSGARSVNALRRYLKMVYDRGMKSGRPLRYALLLGRATSDNRGLTLTGREHALTLPTWQTDEALAEERSYTSDDILAMLDDGSGADARNDRLSIAVGRIPARSTAELKAYVDKLYDYENSSAEGQWRNRVMVVADNGDNGAHADQAETFCARVDANGHPALMEKVYVDAFELDGGVCTEGRRRMFRLLDEGVMWWHYTGHGTEDYFTAEKLLTTSDISSLYLRRLPVLCAVTCSFLRWDGSEPSGAERIALKPDGGAIAAISATRRTFIGDNALMNDALGRFAFARGDDGRFLSLGETLRLAKNHIAETSPAAEGRTRYVLLGDPSIHTVMPDCRITVDEINGTPVEPGTQPVVTGLQTAEIKCTVTDPSGSILPDFNGTAEATLYDSDRSTVTLGRPAAGTEGRRVTFDEHGDRLTVALDTVTGSRFTMRLHIPADIADNMRPATLNIAAYDRSGTRAATCHRGIYVSGTDLSALPDTVPPVIEYAVLNHRGFTDGQTVNPEPVLLARVTDDTAINLSTAGIGSTMTLRLDDARTLPDLSSYYSPQAVTEGAAGTIAYPLPRLTTGSHTLELRVYDTSGNEATAMLRFHVSENAGPRISEVYTDTNPASTQARFYIRHDRPDAILDVEMEVFDMHGRRLWTARNSGRADTAGSSPMIWDLRDNGGHRVERGIYIYRARITDTSGRSSVSSAGRLAVTAR